MTDTTDIIKEEADAIRGAAEAAPVRSGQPQFYQTPEPLSASRHARLGLKANADLDFARNAVSVMLTAAEFALASRTYPIVFTDTNPPVPVALVGVRPDENLFVKDGRWEDRAYVPAFVRRYPFAFVESDDGSRLILCIDTSADAVSVKGEAKLFDGDEPTETTRKALEFCTAFQTQHNITQQLGRSLKELDLLVARQAELTLSNGQKLAVRDFLAVDEARLSALSDEAFLQLRRTGMLPFIYFHIMSLANFRDLASRVPV